MPRHGIAAAVFRRAARTAADDGVASWRQRRHAPRRRRLCFTFQLRPFLFFIAALRSRKIHRARSRIQEIAIHGARKRGESGYFYARADYARDEALRARREYRDVLPPRFDCATSCRQKRR